MFLIFINNIFFNKNKYKAKHKAQISNHYYRNTYTIEKKENISVIQPNKFTIETKQIQLSDIINQPLEKSSELIKKQKWKT